MEFSLVWDKPDFLLWTCCVRLDQSRLQLSFRIRKMDTIVICLPRGDVTCHNPNHRKPFASEIYC